MTPPPGYPSETIVLTLDKIMSFLDALDFIGMTKLHEGFTTTMSDCDVLAIKTCTELEGKFCDYIQAHYKKPLLLTRHTLPEEFESKLEQRTYMYCIAHLEANMYWKRTNFRNSCWDSS
ncbi:hypothetical protein FEM48_Zijuj12G0108000 [Ziziphus jujuba var. spinosa]|uniref:Uncharacterized protein n=1 Tax=Ziziphus jujuba var. spinosa TaxID=714518 RepID=A0A978UCV8_ZIZJJ|nr:hypothetical protein FEM48_Zijuj12G0108000 [Ziziphus jujuba var. spinosa]